MKVFEAPLEVPKKQGAEASGHYRVLQQEIAGWLRCGGYPNKVLYEADLASRQVADLSARGHDLEPWPAGTWMAGGICMALREDSKVLAVADPRRAGTSATGLGSPGEQVV